MAIGPIQCGVSAPVCRTGPTHRSAVSWAPRTRSLLVCITLSIWLLLVQFVPTCAQTGRYSDVRALVGRVQEDLRRAAGMASPRGKDFQRVDNAQRHLSQFDRALSKGKFDSGKLDASISDVQSVVDHNTLTPQDRDSLNVDLRDLRAVRTER